MRAMLCPPSATGNAYIPLAKIAQGRRGRASSNARAAGYLSHGILRDPPPQSPPLIPPVRDCRVAVRPSPTGAHAPRAGAARRREALLAYSGLQVDTAEAGLEEEIARLS